MSIIISTLYLVVSALLNENLSLHKNTKLIIHSLLAVVCLLLVFLEPIQLSLMINTTVTEGVLFIFINYILIINQSNKLKISNIHKLLLLILLSSTSIGVDAICIFFGFFYKRKLRPVQTFLLLAYSIVSIYPISKDLILYSYLLLTALIFLNSLKKLCNDKTYNIFDSLIFGILIYKLFYLMHPENYINFVLIPLASLLLFFIFYQRYLITHFLNLGLTLYVLLAQDFRFILLFPLINFDNIRFQFFQNKLTKLDKENKIEYISYLGSTFLIFIIGTRKELGYLEQFFIYSLLIFVGINLVKNYERLINDKFFQMITILSNLSLIGLLWF